MLFSKNAKKIENDSADYQKILFCFLKVQNILKILQLITKQKKASLNGLQNFLKLLTLSILL